MRLFRKARAGVAASTLVLAGAVLISSASPASAEPAKPAMASAPTHGDACTLSPDSGYAPFYFNFHDACHWHDGCYASAPYGRNEWGRLQCDVGFLSRMVSWCNNRYAWWNPGRGNCTNVANAYYAAVRTAGAAFFY